MKNHLESIRILSEQQSRNQEEAKGLAEKCDKLGKGIDLFVKARKVLSQRLKRLNTLNHSIGQKIQWEITEIQKQQADICDKEKSESLSRKKG